VGVVPVRAGPVAPTSGRGRAGTADVPAADAGIIGGLANIATQVGGSVSLAVLVAVAGSTAARAAAGSSQVGAFAAGYDVVFLVAAGLSLAIATGSLLLPRPAITPGPDPRKVP
jgi:hypothetical protein